MSLSYCLGNCGDSTSMYEPQGASGDSVQRRNWWWGGVGWGVWYVGVQKQGREGQNQEREREKGRWRRLL